MDKPVPWAVEEKDCPKCNYYWISVHPVLEYVKCPICKTKIPTQCDLLKYIERTNN